MRFSAGSIIVRASSGSRLSISSVEPLRSANNAVIVLRWPSVISAPDCVTSTGITGTGAENVAAAICVPHLRQKRALRLIGAPQAGQESSSIAPQYSQNSESSLFGVRHLGHSITASLRALLASNVEIGVDVPRIEVNQTTPT